LHNVSANLKHPKTNGVATRDLLRALARESLKYRAITIIAACTGMRRGEILGIGDDSLDLDNCAIKINRASSNVSGQGIILAITIIRQKQLCAQK
jgi:integrase